MYMNSKLGTVFNFPLCEFCQVVILQIQLDCEVFLLHKIYQRDFNPNESLQADIRCGCLVRKNFLGAVEWPDLSQLLSFDNWLPTG